MVVTAIAKNLDFIRRGILENGLGPASVTARTSLVIWKNVSPARETVSRVRSARFFV